MEEPEGGGWYGGSGNVPDETLDNDRGGGGGSGFVWTAETASNVPSGYSVTAEYYLTEASTEGGNTTFISPNGGNETGHLGNGYAKITLINVKGKRQTTSSGTESINTAYVEEGLILHYDSLNNTGKGHSETTTVWKDLSKNDNDANISGATWVENYLSFDGIDDIASTIKDLNFEESKALTIEFIGQNNNTRGTKIIMELYENSNIADCGFYVDTGEYGYQDITMAMKYDRGGNINHKMVNNIFDNTFSNYTIQFDSTKPYDQYISIYKNRTEYEVGLVGDGLAVADLSNRTILNHKLYIGARFDGTLNSNMNIMAIRVYNRELTQDEIKQNYDVDKLRYNI